MPKLPRLSGREVISVLEAHGYERKRQRGSPCHHAQRPKRLRRSRSQGTQDRNACRYPEASRGRSADFCRIGLIRVAIAAKADDYVVP
jgi:hypothetical protein